MIGLSPRPDLESVVGPPVTSLNRRCGKIVGGDLLGGMKIFNQASEKPFYLLFEGTRNRVFFLVNRINFCKN